MASLEPVERQATLSHIDWTAVTARARNSSSDRPTPEQRAMRGRSTFAAKRASLKRFKTEEGFTSFTSLEGRTWLVACTRPTTASEQETAWSRTLVQRIPVK